MKRKAKEVEDEEDYQRRSELDLLRSRWAQRYTSELRPLLLHSEAAAAAGDRGREEGSS